MKQKLLVTGLWLVLWLPQIVLAQQNNGFSKMQPGDWFEMKVSKGKFPKHKELYEYLIKYQLKKSEPNRRSYQLTFERIKMKSLYYKDSPLGYDSYYPTFRQSGKQTLDKPIFLIEVDKMGKTTKITPQNNPTNVTMNQIAFRKTYGSTETELQLLHTETAQAISDAITNSIARNDITFNGQVIKNTDFSALLTGASFPLQKNTWLTGKISNLTDSIKHKINLYLEDSSIDIYFTKDGSFNIPMFLTASAEITWTYDQRQKTPLGTSLFINPGDTLIMTANGTDFVNSIRFSGKGAETAALGAQISLLPKTALKLGYGPKNFSATDFMEKQAVDKAAFEKVVSRYETSVPPEALIYYRDKFTYEQGSARLEFLLNTTYRSNHQAAEIFEGFPTDFFKSIDTLPVQMKDYSIKNWYTAFIHNYNLYLSNRIGTVNGGGYGFLYDYATSLAYLKMFPLYFSLAEAFENELEDTNWQKAQIHAPYYHDFINNCSDTTLTNRVKEKWELINNWAPGNQSPLKGFKLADDTMLDLNKFKGKALSVTFNFDHPDKLKPLIERIKRQDPNKVHFVIAQLKLGYLPQSNTAELFNGLPNVTFVEVVPNDTIRNKKVELYRFDIKTFIFDPELKVVEDNIDDSNEIPDDHAFDEAIKKAMEPKQMGKEQKAALKIIGWSASFILFPFFIGLWIYKIRIASLKRKEAIKRHIKELEVKAIRSQMNPHFLFNALNSIQSLINNGKYKAADFYLEKFSLLMRMVLNNSEKIFIALSDEIEALGLYVELEKLRFNFSYNIHIAENINADLIEIPGMIIQPLVENAIVHGLAQKGIEGKLEIYIRKEQSCLNITVKDNGKGLNPKPETHKGFGLKLVKERLNLLNTNSTTGKLTLSSNLDENSPGVTAELIIPID